jgi:hypothetical protein
LYHKRREPCVLLLEDVFGATEHPETLRAAGFTVECFRTHFGSDGRPQKSVKDPAIIKLCAAKKFVLFTLDRRIRETHIETIKRTDVAIVASANNSCGITPWVVALIAAKRRLERHIRRTQRPWFGILSKTGELNVRTITPNMTTRRRRPDEGQEVA